MSQSHKILILFAHPHRDQSRVQRSLISAVESLEGVRVVDLYQEYPDFVIDARREQSRFEGVELLIFQHPIYWYSCPPLLKEWMDIVLEKGWAYGEQGTNLQGLDFLQVLSTSGTEGAYQRTGHNRFTLAELLRPFEATVSLCGLRYHKPFVVPGVNSLPNADLEQSAKTYRLLLQNYLQHGRSVLDAFDTTAGVSYP